MEKASTKVTNTAFEKGDRMGLFATTSSGSIKGKRYIDNLALEYTEGSTLVPKRQYSIRKEMCHWTLSVTTLTKPKG